MSIIKFPDRFELPPIKMKLHRFYKIIELALEKKQPIIVGTSDHTVRAIELEQRFPNAHIEIVEIGVKVCPK